MIALTSVTCPLCRKFGPSLARIEATYQERGVKFVFVHVSGIDPVAEMRKQIADLGLKGLHLNDAEHRIGSMLAALTTTEVFVVDAGNTLVYRGATANGTIAFERLRSKFDANGDGKIEKEEVPESLHPQFDRLDRNDDGVLTRDEFGRSAPP